MIHGNSTTELANEIRVPNQVFHLFKTHSGELSLAAIISRNRDLASTTVFHLLNRTSYLKINVTIFWKLLAILDNQFG
jgi:hypothetical protein